MKEKTMKSVIFVILCVLTLTVTVTSSRAAPSIITPRTRTRTQTQTQTRPAQPLSSFKINTSQPNQGSCTFTVDIRTSCSSVRYTRDRISLSFGDAYGNQVYAPKLDDPRSRTFESCSTDRFQISGPCTYQICYLYLYRSGGDGWRPYDVTVYGYNTSPVTFHYDVYVPRDTWYGFNNCYRSAAKSTM